MTELALYDAMVSAITECARVDEVKDIRDKAVALEHYHRQAQNWEAEREACNVRLRAERRVGELLKELAKATPQEAGALGGFAKAGTGDDCRRQPSPYAEALVANGIPDRQARRYQELAEVPQADFDLALKGAKASTEGVIARNKIGKIGSPRMERVSAESLWIWGILRDFESDGILNADWPSLCEKMTDMMREDVHRLAPLVADFLLSLEGENDEQPD